MDFVAMKYGRSNRIMAGDDGFAEFFDGYWEELLVGGKRPDLLLMPKSGWRERLGLDVSELPLAGLKNIVPIAMAGLEIRSSSFLSRKFRAGKGDRTFLSFTPKTEDLYLVDKWIQTYDVPHYYVQVFFDDLYAISFQRILEILKNPEEEDSSFFIEKNAKSQWKSTIHLDISKGVRLGSITENPSLTGEVYHIPNGRLIFYVKFGGGKLTLERDAVGAIVEDARRLRDRP